MTNPMLNSILTVPRTHHQIAAWAAVLGRAAGAELLEPISAGEIADKRIVGPVALGWWVGRCAPTGLTDAPQAIQNTASAGKCSWQHGHARGIVYLIRLRSISTH